MADAATVYAFQAFVVGFMFGAMVVMAIVAWKW